MLGRLYALIIASVLFIASPAFAQEAFTPLDQQAYNDIMSRAAQISMPLLAHNQFIQIMQAAEREAAFREMQAKTKPAPPPNQPVPDPTK